MHCHSVAACATVQRPHGHDGFARTESTINPWPLKEVTERTGQRRCLVPPLILRSLMDGRREAGKRDVEKRRQHITSEHTLAFFPGD